MINDLIVYVKKINLKQSVCYKLNMIKYKRRTVTIFSL